MTPMALRRAIAKSLRCGGTQSQGSLHCVAQRAFKTVAPMSAPLKTTKPGPELKTLTYRGWGIFNYRKWGNLNYR
jgi:hypothetical protein